MRDRKKMILSRIIYDYITAAWTSFAFVALITTLLRAASFKMKRVYSDRGAFVIFDSINSFISWSTINRLVVSLWLVIQGISQLIYPANGPIAITTFIRLAGIFFVSLFIVIGNYFDYEMYSHLKQNINHWYAKDVDFGIVDALVRIGCIKGDKEWQNKSLKSDEPSENSEKI
jgi:hypothetical protein